MQAGTIQPDPPSGVPILASAEAGQPQVASRTRVTSCPPSLDIGGHGSGASTCDDAVECEPCNDGCLPVALNFSVVLHVMCTTSVHMGLLFQSELVMATLK